jgi:hypothetical protein
MGTGSADAGTRAGDEHHTILQADLRHTCDPIEV